MSQILAFSVNKHKLCAKLVQVILLFVKSSQGDSLKLFSYDVFGNGSGKTTKGNLLELRPSLF